MEGTFGDMAFIKARAHHREELGAHELGCSNKTQGGPGPREQRYHQGHTRASGGKGAGGRLEPY